MTRAEIIELVTDPIKVMDLYLFMVRQSLELAEAGHMDQAHAAVSVGLELMHATVALHRAGVTPEWSEAAQAALAGISSRPGAVH